MTTYDKLDWHYDNAVAAGQRPENAFTHIGLYLAWIIQHDLHDPAAFPSDHVTAVKRGDMTGSDLSDDIDTKLTSEVMNAEGRAFSDARYTTYMAEYETAFAGQGDYAVTDDPANYARIAPVIDGLYSAWIADGRPGPSLDESTLPPDASWPDGLESPNDLSQAQVDLLLAEMAGAFEALRGDQPDPEVMSRFAPDLEALVPADLTDPPMRVNSVRASTWGSSLLNRTLRQVGVDPKRASVVIAMGGRGAEALSVFLYGIPGVTADRLRPAIEPAVTRPPKGRWTDREVAGRKVRIAVGPEFAVAFWALDGLVVHVAGSVEVVEHAIPRLP